MLWQRAMEIILMTLVELEGDDGEFPGLLVGTDRWLLIRHVH